MHFCLLLSQESFNVRVHICFNENRESQQVQEKAVASAFNWCSEAGDASGSQLRGLRLSSLSSLGAPVPSPSGAAAVSVGARWWSAGLLFCWGRTECVYSKHLKGNHGYRKHFIWFSTSPTLLALLMWPCCFISKPGLGFHSYCNNIFCNLTSTQKTTRKEHPLFNFSVKGLLYCKRAVRRGYACSSCKSAAFPCGPGHTAPGWRRDRSLPHPCGLVSPNTAFTGMFQFYECAHPFLQGGNEVVNWNLILLPHLLFCTQ